MSENNIQQDTSPSIEIISYSINTNHDGTYCLKFETNVHTIVYPRAKIQFGINQSIIFPTGFIALNKNDEPIFNYILNLKENENQNSDQVDNNKLD